MNRAEIERVESELSVKLPDRYVKFLLGHKDTGAECNLCMDADELIDENRALRKAEYWEPRYFSIGGDGCGNVWCLNLEETSNSIWIWEHDPPNGFRIEFNDMNELFKAYGA